MPQFSAIDINCSQLILNAAAPNSNEIENIILNNLGFSSMDNKYCAVRSAFTGTYNWIFKDNLGTENNASCPWSNFSKWLKEGNGLYWISGKAGSGKSTLMKYIVEDHRTKSSLNEWSGSEGCIIAKHFFEQGTDEKLSSHLGLLRSLQHDIFEQRGGLMNVAFPEEWRQLKDGRYRDNSGKRMQMDSGYLQGVFEKTVKLCGKLCIFIDGLDEYSGDLVEATQFLNLTKPNPNIKICVSSRPEAEIYKILGTQPLLPMLQTQDLTRWDINNYVTAKFWKAEVTKRISKMIHIAQKSFATTL